MENDKWKIDLFRLRSFDGGGFHRVAGLDPCARTAHHIDQMRETVFLQQTRRRT